jgi:transcriptional regulator with XRE-family HTH domain
VSERGNTITLRRHELAAFLRSRRERVTPEDVGLPGGSRRRTAGLRREEVAQLAGVGVTWYTWLEQGRPIRASVQVLEAVARTLRLDPTERQHLFQLAEMPDTAPPDHASPLLRPQVQVILDGLNPMPAFVVTERFDILAWNAAHAVLFPRTAQVAPAARNTLLYCFSRAECCNVIENREDQRAAMAAQLRAAYGHHVGDPPGPPSSGGSRRPAPSSRPCGPPRTWPIRRARHPDGRLHPRQRGHPGGDGTARRGSGRASLRLLAGASSPDS